MQGDNEEDGTDDEAVIEEGKRGHFRHEEKKTKKLKKAKEREGFRMTKKYCWERVINKKGWER